MRVKRRFSTRWGHPYHLQGACATCRQTLLCPLCFIPSMIPESYMEWSAQSKGEDPSELFPNASLDLGSSTCALQAHEAANRFCHYAKKRVGSHGHTPMHGDVVSVRQAP